MTQLTDATGRPLRTAANTKVFNVPPRSPRCSPSVDRTGREGPLPCARRLLQRLRVQRIQRDQGFECRTARPTRPEPTLCRPSSSTSSDWPGPASVPRSRRRRDRGAVRRPRYPAPASRADPIRSRYAGAGGRRTRRPRRRRPLVAGGHQVEQQAARHREPEPDHRRSAAPALPDLGQPAVDRAGQHPGERRLALGGPGVALEEQPLEAAAARAGGGRPTSPPTASAGSSGRTASVAAWRRSTSSTIGEQQLLPDPKWCRSMRWLVPTAVATSRSERPPMPAGGERLDQRVEQLLAPSARQAGGASWRSLLAARLEALRLHLEVPPGEPPHEHAHRAPRPVPAGRCAGAPASGRRPPRDDLVGGEGRAAGRALPPRPRRARRRPR